MNDAIILQQINQDSYYTDIMPLVFARHLNYAKAHGFDYEFSYGEIVEDWKPGQGGWAKLMLIYNALARNYQHVIWVDADSIIVDLRADLRGGCPDGPGLGFVVHRNPIHLNVGNIYVTNSAEVQQFMADWMSWYPGPAGWREQAVLNLLAKTNPLVKVTDDKYNSCRAAGNRVDHPIVEGFHGEGSPENRYKLMKAYLRGLHD